MRRLFRRDWVSDGTRLLTRAETAVHMSGKRPCEFCRTGDHGLCPGVIPRGGGGGKNWLCPCAESGHKVT